MLHLTAETRKNHSVYGFIFDRAQVWLLSAAIIMLPFTNTALVNSPLGAFGAAPAGFFMLTLATLTAAAYLSQPGRLWVSALVAFFYGALSLFFIIKFGGFFYGSPLLNKAFNVAVLYFAALAPVFLVRVEIESIRAPVYICIFTLVASFVALDLMKIDALRNSELIHFFPNVQQRPRGLAHEASVFGSQLIVMACVGALVSKHLSTRLFIVSAVFVLVPLVYSKGSNVTLLIGLVGACAFLFVRRPLHAFLITACILIAVMFTPSVQALISQMVGENRQSVGVRTLTIFSAARYLALHPFGVGFGSSAPALVEALREGLTVFRASIGEGLDYSEIWRDFLNARDDRYITTKNGVMDLLLVFGVPGFVILWFAFFKPLLFKCASSPFFYPLTMIVTTVAVFTYVPLLGMYHFAVALIVARALTAQESRSRPIQHRPIARSASWR